MKVVVTGGEGFLGRHLRMRLLALRPDSEVTSIQRDSTPDAVESAVGCADLVLHCAGVNRGDADDVEHGNVVIASSLLKALRLSGSTASLVYANSIQAGNGTPYGRGKAAAAQVFDQWAQEGHPVRDVLLPNLYGEHGRPGYNSFVATFAHAIAEGRTPTVEVDRPVQLLHVQDAAQALLDAAADDQGQAQVSPQPTRLASVLQVRDMLAGFAATYEDGSIPALGDRFEVTLFNTLRAALFPRAYPFRPPLHTDERGALVESVRVHGGQGQSFVSTTVPGGRRGDHFHLDKIERFQVVRGRGLIRLRRLLTQDYVEFAVDGQHPAMVDMPTGWAHSIENVGNDELVTVFWAHELYDHDRPDTYRRVVHAPDAEETLP